MVVVEEASTSRPKSWERRSTNGDDTFRIIRK